MRNKIINNRKINVSVAGSLETDTGQKTSTLLEQLNRIPSINIDRFFNPSTTEAEKVFKKAKLKRLFKYSEKSIPQKIPSDIKYFTDSLDIFLKDNLSDVIIVSEINTGLATRIIYECLLRKKSVINLNAASEVTLGIIFKESAYKSGVIYSVGAGDEPAATLELVEYCERLGLDIISAGKGKNNPMSIFSNPDNFIDIENKTGVSARSIASFVDGTKTMLEMAILSNATGFAIDKPGMHGPQIGLKDLTRKLCPIKDGGLLNNTPAIDFAIGAVAPGVFVIFTSSQESILEELNYLKMGSGPYYVLYKPYHLGNIESPLSIYNIVLDKKPSLVVKDSFVTTVIGKAKKMLKPGEVLDGLGGYTYFGMAMDFKQLLEYDYVPIGLLEGSKIISQINKDEIVSFRHLEFDEKELLHKLWNEQLSFIRAAGEKRKKY